MGQRSTRAGVSVRRGTDDVGHDGPGPTAWCAMHRPPPAAAPAQSTNNFWLATATGDVYTFGVESTTGIPGGAPLNRPIVDHGPLQGPARLLDGRLRRRHLLLRGYPLLRLDRRPHPQQAHRRSQPHQQPEWLLDGRLRRRHLLLRQRQLLRLDRRPHPQQAHRGHVGDPGRQGVLAGGIGRRGLRLRRRRLLRVDRRPEAGPADRGHGPDPRRQGLLAGGIGRRGLRLRRRRLLRLHGRHAPGTRSSV